MKQRRIGEKKKYIERKKEEEEKKNNSDIKKQEIEIGQKKSKRKTERKRRDNI